MINNKHAPLIASKKVCNAWNINFHNNKDIIADAIDKLLKSKSSNPVAINNDANVKLNQVLIDVLDTPDYYTDSSSYYDSDSDDGDSSDNDSSDNDSDGDIW